MSPNNMNNFEDQIDEILDGMGPGWNKEIKVRHSRNGRKIEYVVFNKTSFEGIEPETTEITVGLNTLECGHQNHYQNNPIAGECMGTIADYGIFNKRTCYNEFCSLCASQCQRCGTVLSVSCCAVLYEGSYVCRGCRLCLIFKKSLRFLLNPFSEVQ